tara:strand:+ start:194 stop:1882 length:1689 start_codon:yes stop_codon:yes gene_type:complete
METIEQGLNNIDLHRRDAIKRHKELFANAVYEAANISNRCCNNLDKEFIRYFPEVASESNTEPFNPTTVVEFRDGKVFGDNDNKCNKIIEEWDNDIGLLPNRQVTGNYYIDIGVDMFDIKITNKCSMYCKLHKVVSHAVTCVGCNKQYTNPSFDTPNLPCGHSWTTYAKPMSCACTHTPTHFIYGSIPSSPDIGRGIDKQLFDSSITHTFEIDNYLNLYHPPTKLYILFNKTAFPNIAFYFQKNIYDSKRMKALPNTELLKESYHKSLDNRDDFLNNITNIIPDDLYEKRDFFNRFRKFDSFSSNRVMVDELESGETDPNISLNNALQKRLNETVRRAEDAENVMNEMVVEYEKQSEDKKNIYYELCQVKKSTLEKENNKNIKMLEKVEELNNTNFKLTKKLMDIEIHKAKTEYLGESYEEMKRTVDDLNLENEKVRNITTRLTSQYIAEKERSENFSQDYNLLTRRWDEIVVQNAEYLKKMKILENELGVKILESNNLTEKIKGFGVGSTNALENALTDKISILENKLEKRNETEIILKKENTLLGKELKKYKDTIGTLFQ